MIYSRIISIILSLHPEVSNLLEHNFQGFVLIQILFSEFVLKVGNICTVDGRY